jgi:hypothetical protein
VPGWLNQGIDPACNHDNAARADRLGDVHKAFEHRHRMQVGLYHGGP